MEGTMENLLSYFKKPSKFSDLYDTTLIQIKISDPTQIKELKKPDPKATQKTKSV
jgi:hypothetical protein